MPVIINQEWTLNLRFCIGLEEVVSTNIRRIESAFFNLVLLSSAVGSLFSFNNNFLSKSSEKKV